MVGRNGAVSVLQGSGGSLLPVGVRGVVGDFRRGDMVSCLSRDGVEVARGLVNYNASETSRIMGASSGEIDSLLGYRGDDELIHRDNLVLL
jgi:glutamate 5-kinase